MSSQDRRETLDAASALERLTTSLERRERNLALEINVACPATVVAFDPATSRVTVTLGFLRVEDDAQTGIETPLPPIQIQQVRVKWPRTAGGLLSFPIVPGDTGNVVFADRALDLWYKAAGSPVDPIDARAHDLADCWFEPGLAPDATAPVTDMTGAVLDSATLIKLGAAAASFALHGTEVHAAFTAWCSAMAAAGTAAAAPPNPDPSGAKYEAYCAAVTTATSALATTLATWLSTKVQIQ